MMVLKSRPQDINFNLSGLAVIVIFYVVSGIFVLGKSVESDVALYSMLLDVAVLASFSAGCLAVLHLKARIVQTFTALFGTGVVFHFLAWPIVEILNSDDLSETLKSSLSFGFLMLLSWQILIYAHIFRNALSVDMTKAVVLSIAYWLMSMTLSQILILAP